MSSLSLPGRPGHGGLQDAQVGEVRHQGHEHHRQVCKASFQCPFSGCDLVWCRFDFVMRYYSQIRIRMADFFQIVRHQEQPLRRPDDVQWYLRLPGDPRVLELRSGSRQPRPVRRLFRAPDDDGRWSLPGPESVRKNDWDLSGQRSLQHTAQDVQQFQQVRLNYFCVSD